MSADSKTARLPVRSVDQVKASEQAWAEANGGATWPLMQRAGEAVVIKLRQLWPEASRVWVLCGPGNNGGDGYIAARALVRAGVEVTVVAPLGAPRDGSDARQAYTEFIQQGGTIALERPEGTAEVLIDALLGTGHRGHLSASLQSLIEALQGQCRYTLSVDIPSGLDAMTGAASPGAVVANHTLTFIAHKPGLLTAKGPGCSGEVSLESLGVHFSASTGGRECFLQKEAAIWPHRPADAHKGRFGTVRVVAGGEMMGGAGLLAAQAALNAGAGRVFWHSLVEHRLAALVAQPELMTAELEEPFADLEAAYVIGPGLGQSMVALRHYECVLGSGFKGVLDADGLTWLASQSAMLPGWVLTPHPGEAARLLSCTVNDIQADRYQAARAIAQAYGATVVLKGAGTIVADDSGWVVVHPGTAAMATPGMGDCLAGMIAALMAQGYSAREAAIAGADRHARLAAGIAQRQCLVLASDVIQALRMKQDA